MDTQLEKDAQLQLANEHCILKKAILIWQLFKRYAEILGQRAFHYDLEAQDGSAIK